MGDHNQYGLAELRRLLAGRSNLEGTQQAIFDPFFVQTRNLAPPPPPLHELISHYYSTNISNLESGSGGWNNNNNNSNDVNTNINSNYSVGFGSSNYNSMVSPGGCNSGAGAGGGTSSTSRWPRQETLTLLEIRSRLDPRFKEANQKGPLWDEVSRILAEEFGYERSGKKCREKFENLYKYYKKTKEGKSGRQDGKHYRFFRQLEAIYGGGDTTHYQSHFLPTNDSFVIYHQNPNNTKEGSLLDETNKQSAGHDQSLSSFTNTTSELESSSEEDNVEDGLSAIAYMMDRSKGKQVKGVANEGQSREKGSGKRGWKVKVKDYVELRMKKMVETQDFRMEKVLKSVEDKEVERKYRQEEWMKQVEDQLDREHGSWAKERARMEARDAAFIEALKFHAGNGTNKELMKSLPLSIEQMAIASHRDHQRVNTTRWSEPEVLSLIQLRTSMEPRFRENGGSKEELWEEVAAKMVGWGCDRSPKECMDKWESMNFYFSMTSTSNSESNYEKWKQDFMRSSRSKEEAKEIGIERTNNNRNNNMEPSSQGYMSNQGQGIFYIGQVSQGVNFWDKNDLKLGNEETQFM